MYISPVRTNIHLAQQNIRHGGLIRNSNGRISKLRMARVGLIAAAGLFIGYHYGSQPAPKANPAGAVGGAPGDKDGIVLNALQSRPDLKLRVDRALASKDTKVVSEGLEKATWNLDETDPDVVILVPPPQAVTPVLIASYDQKTQKPRLNGPRNTKFNIYTYTQNGQPYLVFRTMTNQLVIVKSDRVTVKDTPVTKDGKTTIDFYEVIDGRLKPSIRMITRE